MAKNNVLHANCNESVRLTHHAKQEDIHMPPPRNLSNYKYSCGDWCLCFCYWSQIKFV